MRVVLFGGAGRLGGSIQSLLPCDSPAHSEVDITDRGAVLRFVDAAAPELVINCAALVGAKICDENPARAWLVNTLGASNVADACSASNCKLVYISTNAVFDGAKGNYSEADVPNPAYLYASTKYAAECICASLENHLIIRTDFFSPDSYKYNRVFSDHYTTKEPAPSSADKIVRLISLRATGIYHIGGPRDSLYGILKPFFPDIEPLRIAKSELPDFPRDLSLNTQKYEDFISKRS